ncbi:MAG TPA: TetR/AcrR family transcriptional regulator [Acidimicrobiales bacterium]|nr:TetR/AcrR family transcriptional regulator [Acidimicrobiales bacterium]
MASSVGAGQAGRREERRTQRQDLGRAQLLDAAEDLFGRKGFHEATLKEVAELAEFSVGSVYSFFDNKDDLFRQIFLRRGQEFGPALRAALDPSDGTPTDQLHRLVDVEVGFMRQHPRFGRLYLRYANITTMSVDQAVDAEVTANYTEWLGLLADLFARGQGSGDFRPGEPRVLARLLAGLIASYQALDPAIASGGADKGERFPLADLHELVERAFRA